jgi:hypothetical protein
MVYFFSLIGFLVVQLSLYSDCCCSNLPSRFYPTGMVWIPGGEFAMGSDDADARLDEKPSHKLKVDGFWLDETPVTNRQFKEFVEATGYVTTAVAHSSATRAIVKASASLARMKTCPIQASTTSASAVLSNRFLTCRIKGLKTSILQIGIRLIFQTPTYDYSCIIQQGNHI